MTAPVGGLLAGAVVGIAVGTTFTAVQLSGEQLGGIVAFMVFVVMVPVSLLVTVVTVSGFRVGAIFGAGRSMSRRGTVVAGAAAALLFSAVAFAAASAVIEGFADTFFAIPTAICAVCSVGGGVVARSFPARTQPTLPLAADWPPQR